MRELKLTITFLLVFLACQGQNKNFIDQPYLEVTGSADTLVTPNEIFIKILVNEKDTKDKISVEELELKMYDSLKAIGIDVEKNLTTTDLTSNFKYYFLKSKDVLKSKQYLLRVADAVTASKVFIELENIGISNTSIDRVDHTELESIRNQMRTRAVENARTRALALVKPLGQALGSAINITDSENYNAGNELQGRLAGVVVVGYGVRKKTTEEPPNIEFQKIRITTNVSLKFILKP